MKSFVHNGELNMGWFARQATKGKKSRVMNVIAVMLAGGQIDPSEKDILAVVVEGLV